jgi:hypothetical protein
MFSPYWRKIRCAKELRRAEVKEKMDGRDSHWQFPRRDEERRALWSHVSSDRSKVSKGSEDLGETGVGY